MIALISMAAQGEMVLHASQLSLQTTVAVQADNYCMAANTDFLEMSTKQ